MLSVSGKNWEETKVNNRILDKLKIEKNFSEIVSKIITIPTGPNICFSRLIMPIIYDVRVPKALEIVLKLLKALESKCFIMFVCVPVTIKSTFHWKYECFENHEEQLCVPQQ